MKKHFHLRFKIQLPAMVKYIDPTYNECRLWASRLLAQFFKEGAVIISIDESNFRVDAFKRRKWTFVPDNRSVCNLMSSTALDTESQLPPIDQALLPAPIVSSSPAAVEEGNVESELLTRSRSLIKGCSKRTKQARASSKSNSNQLR